jgi:hypothetical protein
MVSLIAIYKPLGGDWSLEEGSTSLLAFGSARQRAPSIHRAGS